MEYDGVNGVVLLNNDQGTDGSGGTTSSTISYRYNLSGGIVNMGWNGLYATDDEVREAFETFGSQEAFEDNLSTNINLWLNSAPEEGKEDFYSYFRDCQIYSS